MSASSLSTDERRHLGGDLLAVCLLGVLVLVPLATTYAGWWWAAVGCGAVSLGATTVHQVRVRGWSVWLLPFLLVTVYVLAALPLTSRHRGLGALLPGENSLNDIILGTVECWGELIQTLPRVDATGRVLVVPLVLGLVPAALSATLAMFSSRAVLPVLPFLPALALSIALGRGEPWLALLGLPAALVSMWWMADRQGRGAPRSAGVARRVVARLAMFAVAILVAQLATSAVVGEQEPTLLRQSVARGMDTTTVPTLLDGFRRYTDQPLDPVDNVHDVRLLTVRDAPKRLRLRFVTLDWYDGSLWRPNPDTSPSASTDRFLEMGRELDNPSSGPSATVQVRVGRGWRSNWVPTAGQLQELGFHSDEAPDVRYNLATSTAILDRWLKPGEQYYFESRLPDDSLTPDMVAAQGVDPELRARAAFVAPLADAYLRANPTPMRALLDAAHSLRRKGAYSDGAVGWERGFPEGHGVERLGELFLFAPQTVGNAEQYAAAMALIALRMDIPARVVVGSVVPPRGVIRGNDVEAWIEVQLEDGSWRTLPTGAFLGRQAPKRKLNRQEQRRLDLMPPRRQIRQEQQRLQQQQQQQQQQEQTRPPQDQDPDGGPSRRWWWLLLGLVVGAVPGAKEWRRHRRRHAMRVPSRFSRGWLELVDTSRDLGARVPRTFSRPRQAVVMGRGRDLAVLADERTFGPDIPDEDEAAQFWELIDAEREAMFAEQSRWRRLRAVFDPRTLWRG